MITWMTIFNFVVTVSIVIYLIWKYFPFFITVHKTFWKQKPFAITLWFQASRNIITAKRRSAKDLFTLRFRNEEKLNKWDSKQYKEDYFKDL